MLNYFEFITDSFCLHRRHEHFSSTLFLKWISTFSHLFNLYNCTPCANGVPLFVLVSKETLLLTTINVWGSSTDVRMYVALSQYNVSVKYISNVTMNMYATLNYPLFVLLAALSTFKIKTYTTPTLYYFTLFFLYGKWDCSHLLLLNLGLFSFSYLVIYRVKWDGVELRTHIFMHITGIFMSSVSQGFTSGKYSI